MQQKTRIAPSILASDFARLGEEVRAITAAGADYVHVDVMDGHFVPNLTFGLPVIAALRKHTEIPLDVHLMVTNPARLLDDYIAAGASRIAVHWEAATHLDRLLTRIREQGAEAGVAVNPSTPVEWLGDVLHRLDFVLLMSVNPGFAGQPFLPHVVDKARRLKKMIESAATPVEIAMDGGVDAGNIRDIVAAGVQVCVAGSAVFAESDPIQAMRRLKALASREE